MNRKTFLQQTGGALAGTLIADSVFAHSSTYKKQRIALVGTGDRGTSMWGTPVVEEFPDQLEFVGLCDINAGRVETAKKMLGISCPTFTDFDKMMKK